MTNGKNRTNIIKKFRKEGDHTEDLTKALIEELNCKTVFTIPVFGGIAVDEGVVVTWIIMMVLALLSILFVRNLKVENPGKVQLALESVIEWGENFFKDIIGEENKRYIPWLMTVALYLACANLIGLFGFKPPTKDLNITAGLAIMSMLLIVSTGCGKSGSGDSSSDKKTDKTETLADVNTIPEDGVITKEQFKTVAGENKKVQFKGTTDDGITYIWTYDCSKIQNPADQNLKIDFSEKGLDDLKKQANNANDALKMTMYGKGLICVPDLEVQLPEAWQSNSAYLVKEQAGKLARMSDVTVTAQAEEDSSKKEDTTAQADSSDKAAEATTAAKKDTKPQKGTTSLKMSVTSLDGDCYIIGGITEQQNKGASAANKAENGTTNSESEGSDESGNSGENSYNEEGGSGSASSSGSSGKQDVANDEEVSGSSHTCTISISCATILNNMSDLKSGKEEFVPSDGWILAASEVEFTEGESVHDVLQRVCKDAGIQMESSFTPAYNSAYVEGINNLYEFDCGQLSGWMYNVNGWFPNYGCSKYTVQDGDVINWVYTCNLGKDVGDNSMY